MVADGRQSLPVTDVKGVLNAKLIYAEVEKMRVREELSQAMGAEKRWWVRRNWKTAPK